MNIVFPRKDALKQLMKLSYSARLLAGGACLVLLLGVPAVTSIPAQTAAGANQEAQQRKTSKPYTGDLSAFEYKDRDKKLQIERVMDILGIGPGKNVADIGAGSGWFSVRAARRVTRTGLVYAVDINNDAIHYIEERAHRENINNMRTILSRSDGPLLPPESIDAVLLLKTYHEVAQPITLMKNLRKALRPGARVGVIDRNGDAENHGVSRDIVVREARQAGYTLVAEYNFVKSDNEDYFLVLEAR
jgi:2-polyprenyl-3-methyl-5-hydroxy-6-metoxy-1,4-benzoquinol methylase